MSVCFQIGAPGANQDFVCLLWGEAEVRVAHYPLGTQNKGPLFWESGGTCRPMMQGISLCDHVTERDVIGQCDLIVEREANHNSLSFSRSAFSATCNASITP